MYIPITPSMYICSFFIGLLSAYLAHKRGKNPYLWFVLGFLFGMFGIFAIFFISSRKKSPQPQPRVPILKISGPTDKFWYYLDPNHKSHGPMSRDALSAMWKAGKINLSTYVWHEEMPAWKPLKETVVTEI